MWYRLLLWLVAGSLALTMALPAGSASAAAPARGVYLALSDSLAVGVGATDPRRTGYVPRFFRYLRGATRGQVNQLDNIAVGGETSATFITAGQLTQAIASINDPDTDVRVVTLSIGGNDVRALLNPGAPCAEAPTSSTCLSKVQETLGSFATNYTTILGGLTQALAADPGEELLLVMTVHNPYSGTGSLYEAPADAVLLGSDMQIDCSAGGAAIGLNDLIACIGQTFGARVVDIYPLFAGRGPGRTHIEAGDIHPNTAGYRAIATAFKRAYRS